MPSKPYSIILDSNEYNKYLTKESMADHIVEELVQAAENFLVPLRMGDGLDYEAFKHLCDVLRMCKQEWREKDAIPKGAAAILVDLFSLTYGCKYIYDDSKAEQISKAAYDLDILVTDSVG